MGAVRTRTRRAEIRRTSRRRRGRLRALLTLSILALVLGAGVGFVWLLTARSPLTEARDFLLDGRRAILDGRAGESRAAFAQAETAFQEAADRLGNPFTRLASWIPVLGRTPDAVIAIAESGELAARAAADLAAAAEALPGGIGALAPRDGVIDIEPFRRLAPAVAASRDLMDRAHAIVRDTPDGWVLQPVRDPYLTFSSELDEAHEVVVAADAVVRTIPSFLGEDGTKRYFLGAQNPAELRGTGGLIGSFAILTIDDGRIDLGDFRDIGKLDEVDDPTIVAAPNEDFASLYPGIGDWSVINMTPDFPSAAISIERLYQEVEGAPLDGTILADPHSFARLLQAAGPAEVPGIGTTVDARSVVPFVTNEAYSVLGEDARKRVLGDVAGAVFDKYLTGVPAEEAAAAGLALVEASGDGHLLFHATDPQVQAGFVEARVSGALLDPRGDYLSVVVNNAGGNKIDFYASRSIRYDVRLGADQTALATTEVTFHNQAPDAGLPVDVIGPHPFVADARPGDNIMIAHDYCSGSCRLGGFHRDGVPQGLQVKSELGHPVAVTGALVPSGGTQSLTFDWSIDPAWEGGEGVGSYRLTVQTQPTIRPTEMEIHIQPPPGMAITQTEGGLQVVGGGATWSGRARDVMRFQVSFERPFAERVWRALLGFRPLAAI